MRRRNRVLVLSHLTFSVGWLGLEVSLLTLAVAALLAGDAEAQGAAVRSAALLGSTLYPLFSVGALVTGVVVSLRGPWGLVRYWWVLGKLVANLALVLGGNLLVLAGVRGAADRLPQDASGAVSSVVGAMTIGLVLLLASTVVSRYKPRWRTPYRRRQDVNNPATRRRRADAAVAAEPGR